MTAAAVAAGLLAGASVWSLRLAWAATTASRVRDRLLTSAAPALSPPKAPVAFAIALHRAGVAWPADATWAAWLAAVALAAVAGAVVGGPALAVIAAVAATAGPVVALRTAGGRGDRRLEAAVPVALERVARSLRSGAAPVAALREAAAHTASGDTMGLASDLAAVVADVDAGEPFVAALDRWAERRPLPSIRLAVAALALGAETGGAQAQALDGLATTLRDRLAVAAEVRALSSQARLSALVITVAPLGFALFAAATDPRSAAFLLRTPLGIVCLCVGLTLDAIAAWWMARLTRPPA